MRAILRLMVTIGVGLVATGAYAQAVELPTGFDGTYAPDGQACEGASLITVENGTMIGMDGGMTVTDLIEDPANPRRVEATLLNEGGGGEWTDSAVITLAEDGQSLRFDYPDGSTVTWLRCD